MCAHEKYSEKLKIINFKINVRSSLIENTFFYYKSMENS